MKNGVLGEGHREGHMGENKSWESLKRMVLTGLRKRETVNVENGEACKGVEREGERM